jgi:hypothetical protein
VAREPLARAVALALALLAACGRDEVEGGPAPAPLPPETAAAPADADVPGLWRAHRAGRVDPALSAEQRELVARLEAIGYAEGSAPAPDLRGVTRRDPRAWTGTNFYTSGHAPEAILMDMDGHVLHRWRRAFLEIWPDYPRQWLAAGHSDYWRRAHLFGNGDVLVIFEGMGIARLDRDSRVLWSNPVQAHHDLDVTPEGDVYVLTRRARIVPELHPEKPVLEDFVTVLDAGGRERRSVSVLEALRRSDFAGHFRYDPGQRWGDVLHTNTVQVLDGRGAERLPAFRAGNVLVSILKLDLLAVVDLDAERIVWAHAGRFRRQHDPRLLDDGRLLLFDNRGDEPRSRVVELDPAAPDEWLWEFGGSPSAPFFSFSCGAAARLPNGNTLITESDAGRAFEVTRDKEIVWEFYNPHRAGQQDELIATLFEVVRLPPDFPLDWLPGAAGAP